MVEKGRVAKKFCIPKLNDVDLKKIRSLSSIMNQKEIAYLFRVTPSTISYVLTNKRKPYAA